VVHQHGVWCSYRERVCKCASVEKVEKCIRQGILLFHIICFALYMIAVATKTTSIIIVPFLVVVDSVGACPANSLSLHFRTKEKQRGEVEME
jgi:hypothetical protein